MIPEAQHKPRQYLRVNDMLARYGISRASLYRLVGDGALPAPGYLTKRTPVWLESDLDKHDDDNLKGGLNNG